MSRLMRYSPFFNEPIPDALESLLRPGRGFTEEPRPRMDIDLSETDTAYILQAEIPGVNKEDINIDIDGDAVRITANKSTENSTGEQARTLRSERYRGALQRVIILAAPLDEEKATASYENGVLSLMLPKKTDSDKRRIPIS